MKKLIRKILLVLVVFLFADNVHAAGLSVSASSTSVTIGSSVVVRVTASDLAGRFSVTSSNGGVLAGGSGSTWIENSTQTFTFRANAVGSATVTVTPVDVADYSGNVYSSSKSVTINVKAKPVIVLSSDNGLSSLGVEGKEISPAFNRDTLEYSVELDPETTSINVLASPSHGGAGIVGAGTREVVDGENRLEIVVTAENGASRTYVLNASVKEYNPIKQTVDGKEYTVVRKRSLLESPENYTETTVKISDEEVPAYTSEVTKYTLVGLRNENGNINLYVYKDGTYTLYQEYTFNKVKFYPLEMKKSDIPEGYSKTTITYNDKKIVAYKMDGASNFAILYGMNVETGETHMYMYDEEEDTLQIYNDERVKVLEEELDQMKLIVAILVGGCVFLFLLCIIVGSRKGKPDKKKNENYLDSIDDIKVTEIESKKGKNNDDIQVVQVKSSEVKIKKQARSKILLISNILSTLYVSYLLIYFIGSTGDMNSAEEIGGAIATALVFPHILVIGIGVIFAWIGFFMKKSWAALVGGILYSVGALLFMLYILYVIPLIVLGFVGYTNQKKLNNQVINIIDVNYDKEAKLKAKEDARKLKEELKLQKKLNKKNKGKEKEEKIDIRDL